MYHRGRRLCQCGASLQTSKSMITISLCDGSASLYIAQRLRCRYKIACMHKIKVALPVQLSPLVEMQRREMHSLARALHAQLSVSRTALTAQEPYHLPRILFYATEGRAALVGGLYVSFPGKYNGGFPTNYRCCATKGKHKQQ